ncbi:MAG: hypothetical protein ABI923_13680 [bacterium]
MRLFLFSLLVVLCLSCMLGAKPIGNSDSEATRARSVFAVRMPKQCQSGKSSPEGLGWRWKPGTSVKIAYLKDDFNQAEKEAFFRAINNWNKALEQTASQVVFVTSDEPEGLGTNGASITVARGIPRGRERVGEIRFHSIANGRVQLIMTVSPVVTDLSALTSLMTHELGHSLGLADCYECRRGTTAMAAFKSKNKGNEVFEPSECDKYVVASGYAEQKSAQASVVRIEAKPREIKY